MANVMPDARPLETPSVIRLLTCCTRSDSDDAIV